MTDRPTDEELGDQFQAAMEEWYASEDAELWDSVTGDGLDPEQEEAWEEALGEAFTRSEGS